MLSAKKYTLRDLKQSTKAEFVINANFRNVYS
jgi:hypothetical protein